MTKAPDYDAQHGWKAMDPDKVTPPPLSQFFQMNRLPVGGHRKTSFVYFEEDRNRIAKPVRTVEILFPTEQNRRVSSADVAVGGTIQWHGKCRQV